MKNIKYILICGAGMMGKNIAFVMASNPSYEVGVYDLYDTDVAAGIRNNTKELVAAGAITEEELASRLSRISFTTNMDSELISRADLVIEAVFEDMDLKRETFAKLEARCRPDTIFCTNSSVMSPSEISRQIDPFPFGRKVDAEIEVRQVHTISQWTKVIIVDLTVFIDILEFKVSRQ